MPLMLSLLKGSLEHFGYNTLNRISFCKHQQCLPQITFSIGKKIEIEWSHILGVGKWLLMHTPFCARKSTLSLCKIQKLFLHDSRRLFTRLLKRILIRWSTFTSCCTLFKFLPMLSSSSIDFPASLRVCTTWSQSHASHIIMSSLLTSRKISLQSLFLIVIVCR